MYCIRSGLHTTHGDVHTYMYTCIQTYFIYSHTHLYTLFTPSSHRNVACAKASCTLCANSQHRRCRPECHFQNKYIKNDLLKARCDASVRVQLIDRKSGEPVYSDARLKVCVCWGGGRCVCVLCCVVLCCVYVVYCVVLCGFHVLCLPPHMPDHTYRSSHTHPPTHSPTLGDCH